MNLVDIKLQVVPHLDEFERVQVRFPRSRKRRVRRKWSKQERNFARRFKPQYYYIHAHNVFVCGPRTLEYLKAHSDVQFL